MMSIKEIETIKNIKKMGEKSDQIIIDKNNKK